MQKARSRSLLSDPFVSDIRKETAPIIWALITSWVILLCSMLRLNRPEFCSNRGRHTKPGKRDTVITSIPLIHLNMPIFLEKQVLSRTSLCLTCRISSTALPQELRQLVRVLHRGVRIFCLSLLVCSKARFCTFWHLKADSLSTELWKS